MNMIGHHIELIDPNGVVMTWDIHNAFSDNPANAGQQRLISCQPVVFPEQTFLALRTYGDEIIAGRAIIECRQTVSLPYWLFHTFPSKQAALGRGILSSCPGAITNQVR